MIDVNDEALVLEILQAAQIPVDQLSERTAVNSWGRVVTLRLNPCIGLQALPSCIGDLDSLEEVYLFWGGSDFVCLPASMDRFSKLKVLQLRWCINIASLPTSFGTKITSLQELVLEGCTNLLDLSCLQHAKRHWIHLQSIKIVGCANANFTEVFGVDDDDGDDKDAGYFPSLQRLCLRRNSLTGSDLAKLWVYFQRCPSLTTINVSDNHIETLQHLSTTCLLISKTSTRTSGIRRLHLAGNPVLKATASTDSSSTKTPLEIVGTIPSIRHPIEQEYLVQILQLCPKLESILSCGGSGNRQQSTTPTSSYECLTTSSLYSPQIQHALDLNRASHGLSAKLFRNEPSLPMFLWPTLLEKMTRSNGCPRRTTLFCCRRCSSGEVDDSKQLKRREASVLFSLLKGPVFASRLDDS